jgi:hypothetical protein
MKMRGMGEFSESEIPGLQEKLNSAQLEADKPFVGEKSYDPEFERLTLHPDMRAGEDINAMMERIAKATTKDVIDLMGLRLTMSEKDRVALLLWMCQTHLRGVLPNSQCVHLLLKGTTGTGKTEVLYMCETVCHNAKIIGGITPSALKRSESIATLLIDEVDVNPKEIDGDLLKALRQSESWVGLDYVFSEKGKDGRFEVQNTKRGGPIAFSARELDDSALKTRALVIAMRRATWEESDEGRQFDVRTKARQMYDGPIRDFVQVRAKRIKDMGLTQGQVLSHMTSKAMSARTVKFKDLMPRRYSQASLFLTISDLFQLDIESYLTEILTDQPDEEQWEQEKEFLVQVLLVDRPDLASVRRGEAWVPQSEILAEINAKLKNLSYPPMRRGRFDRFLADIGFVKDLNRTKRSDHSGKMCLKFDATVRKNIGLDKPTQETVSSIEGVGV